MEFIKEAQNHNLMVALAGSLEKRDILRISDLGADIIGVRGAVCTNKDRVAGRIQKEKVMEFAKEISIL